MGVPAAARVVALTTDTGTVSVNESLSNRKREAYSIENPARSQYASTMTALPEALVLLEGVLTRVREFVGVLALSLLLCGEAAGLDDGVRLSQLPDQSACGLTSGYDEEAPHGSGPQTETSNAGTVSANVNIVSVCTAESVFADRRTYDANTGSVFAARERLPDEAALDDVAGAVTA